MADRQIKNPLFDNNVFKYNKKLLLPAPLRPLIVILYFFGKWFKSKSLNGMLLTKISLKLILLNMSISGIFNEFLQTNKSGFNARKISLVGKAKYLSHLQ